MGKAHEHYGSHGTGAMSEKYSDHHAGDGYSWIVLRARKMTRSLPALAGGGPKDPDAFDLLKEIVIGIEDMRSRGVIDDLDIPDDVQWLNAKLEQARSLLSTLGEG